MIRSLKQIHDEISLPSTSLKRVGEIYTKELNERLIRDYSEEEKSELYGIFLEVDLKLRNFMILEWERVKKNIPIEELNLLKTALEKVSEKWDIIPSIGSFSESECNKKKEEIENFIQLILVEKESQDREETPPQDREETPPQDREETPPQDREETLKIIKSLESRLNKLLEINNNNSNPKIKSEIAKINGSISSLKIHLNWLNNDSKLPKSKWYKNPPVIVGMILLAVGIIFTLIYFLVSNKKKAK